MLKRIRLKCRLGHFSPFFLLRPGLNWLKSFFTMKTISISNAAYGRLWMAATEDEESEEDIILRLLDMAGNLDAANTALSQRTEPVGFVDSRFGVRFPENFEIFRNYKGTDYRARASGGKWHLDGHNQLFESLSALSSAIGAQTENAWLGWKYIDDGKIRAIANMRPPSSVKTRRRVRLDE